MSEPTFEELLEKYTSAFDTMSDKAVGHLRKKVVDATDQFLYSYGEPKSYAGYRGFASTLCEGLIAWLIAEGYLIVPATHVVGDDERAERLRRREERRRPTYREPDDATVAVTPSAYL